MMQKKPAYFRPQEALRQAMHDSGGYLHMGGDVLTKSLDYAWRGTAAQFEKLGVNHSEYTLVKLS